jgi:hypothetical protein
VSYFLLSRTVMNFSVVMIAFKKVMPAKAQYTQSCLVMAANSSTAAIAKKMMATFLYHSGDALVRGGWSIAFFFMLGAFPSAPERSFF